MYNFQRVVRVAAYLIVVVFAAFRGYQLIGNRINTTSQVSSLVGKKVDARLPLDSAAATLVFVVSTQCIRCEENIAFYRKLTLEVIPEASGKLQSVAVFPEDVQTATQHVRNVLKIKFNQIVQGPIPGLDVTPSLVLVDQQGIVRSVWGGLYGRTTEEEILEALQNITKQGGRQHSLTAIEP